MVGKASYLSRFLSPLVRLLGSKWSAQMKLKDAHNSCGIFKWVFTSGFSKNKLQHSIFRIEKWMIFLLYSGGHFCFDKSPFM